MRFYGATLNRRADIRLFCQLLFYTGARIAEIHNLTTRSIDFSNKTVIIESLKKRQKGIFREIPIPSHILKDLKVYIDCLEDMSTSPDLLFAFSLRTASRYVKGIMRDAKVAGIRSSSRGLRHGFAVHAVKKVPITLVKRWLGHATLETTEIYLGVIGPEEREMARRIW